MERLSLSKSLAEFRRRSGERKSRSFSPATCAAEKILLGLQVWNLCAVGAQIMRAADCSPFVKKEYFLTATTPQAIACGVSAQLVQKPRRVSPPQRRKKVSIIFSGDMRGGENTSRAASVEFVCRRRTNYARSRLQPLCQKGILFDKLRRPVRAVSFLCVLRMGSCLTIPENLLQYRANRSEESTRRFLI